MNRITSPHLPRAKALVQAFRNEGLPAGGGTLGPREESAREHSPVGWSVGRQSFATQLQQRLDGRTMPDQHLTSYCGCAAFLYCLMEDRPDWYVAYATALWRGEPFSFRAGGAVLNVRVGVSARDALPAVQTGQSGAGHMTDLDWMTMACLSAATSRSGDSLTRVSPGERFHAITWPYMVKRWFASVGAPARVDSVGYGLALAGLDNLLALLAQWDNCWLVMEIDASLLLGGGTSIQQRHWVVVDPETRPSITPAGQQSALTPTQFAAQDRAHPFGNGPAPNNPWGAAGARQAKLDGSITNLRVVSWADEHTVLKTSTLSFVADRFYGGYAFPRFYR